MNKCNSVIELAKKGFHLNEHDTAIICGCVSHWYKVDDKTLIENPDMYQDCFAFSIAYRDNEGFEPNFSGPKEVLLVGGKVLFGRDADGLDWRIGDDLPPGKIPVGFWRPYLGAEVVDAPVAYDTTSQQVESFAKDLADKSKIAIKPALDIKFNEGVIGHNRLQAMSDIIEKEAAIHKAWVDLNGSLQNLTNPIEDGNHKQLVICTKAYERFSLGCYTNAIFTNDIGDDYWKVICTIKEFTSYCEKMAAEELRMKVIMQNGNEGLHYDNTAQQVEALAVNAQSPIFTQSMADTGELPPVGYKLKFTHDIDGDFSYLHSEKYGWEHGDNLEVIHAMTNHHGTDVLIVLNAEPDVLTTAVIINPMFFDTRTEKEKAVDAALALDSYDSKGCCKLSRRDFCGKLYDAKLLNTKAC